jgi:hypothetical protein
VGTALLQIRDERLYRATHATFEEYCRQRWQWSRIHVHRQIEAARVAENLVPMGTKPTSERQVRPLTQLEPEEQKEAWQEAVALPREIRTVDLGLMDIEELGAAMRTGIDGVATHRADGGQVASQVWNSRVISLRVRQTSLVRASGALTTRRPERAGPFVVPQPVEATAVRSLFTL